MWKNTVDNAKCATKAALLWKRSYLFRPGNRAEVFIWKDFQPGYRDLGRKTRDIGNRASPPSHMNTSTFLQRK